MGFQIGNDIFGGIIRTAAPVNNINKTHFKFIEIRGITITAKYGWTNIYLCFSV